MLRTVEFKPLDEREREREGLQFDFHGEENGKEREDWLREEGETPTKTFIPPGDGCNDEQKKRST